MQVFAPLFTFAAAIGLYQAFRWDLVTLVFAMAAMVPIPNYITDRMMHPATRQKFETDSRYLWGFLIAVSVLAFAIFSSETNGFDRVEADVTKFAAIWWFTFPMGCAVLLLFDRVFDVFGNLRVHAKDYFKRENHKPPAPSAPSPEDENVIEFDPKRFR